MHHRTRLAWPLVVLLAQGCTDSHERADPGSDPEPTGPSIDDGRTGGNPTIPVAFNPPVGVSASLVLGADWNIGYHAIAYADLDADGLDDIVLGGTWVHDAHGGGVLVVYGREASFGGTVPITAPDLVLREDLPESYAPQIAVADLDGDGIDDLAVAIATPRQNVIHVLYGGGPRRTGVVPMSDVAATLALDTSTGVARAGDLDGDGTEDLVVNLAAGLGNDGLGIVYGQPERWSGTSPLVVGSHLATADAGWPLWGAAAGDVDGDGHRDLLVTTYASDYTTRLVYGPIARGNVAVTSASPAIGGLAQYEVATGEFDANGDGLSDFLIPREDRSFAVVSGNRTRFGASIDAASVAVLSPPCDEHADLTFGGSAGDVDGDGNDDLFLGFPECSLGAGQAAMVFGAITTQSLTDAPRSWLGSHSSTAPDGHVIWPATIAMASIQNGDIDGDGYADTLFSNGAGLDTLRVIDIVYGASR